MKCVLHLRKNITFILRVKTYLLLAILTHSSQLGSCNPINRSSKEQPVPMANRSLLSYGNSWLSNVSFGGYNLCLTPGCISAANFVLRNMNPDVDPCDDFYQFACGTFLKTTPTPPKYKPVTSTSSTVEKLLREEIHEILSEPVVDTDIKPYKMAKYLHKACMDERRIEELGVEPAKIVLKKLGGWPVLEDNWNEDNFTWMDSVYRFRKEGFSVDYFFDFSIGIYPKNNSVRIMYMTPAQLGLKFEYLRSELNYSNIVMYYSYMVHIAVLFGADQKRAINELKDSLDFEIALATISRFPTNNSRHSTNTTNTTNVTDKFTRQINIRELKKAYPSIPWLEYINTILAPNIQVNETEQAIIINPSYFSKLENLLKATPKRTQANYVMWRAAASSLRYLNSAIRKYRYDLRTFSLENILPNHRWYECAEVVMYSSLNLAIGSMYVKRNFKDGTKKDALDMVEKIRQQMYIILDSVDWMDNRTRKNALDKAHAMVNHIAYPDELLMNSKLTEYYDTLDVDPNEYYMSMLNLTRFGTDHHFSKLKQPVNKSDWTNHGGAAVVNAFYYNLENSIEFPAGILQHAFFRNDRPRYMNYGAIGSVIGHEITHGFDNYGSQFDKNGNFREWWEDPNTKDRFLKKAKCIVNQYNNYTELEVNMKIDGKKTQGENIADNGGVKEAYYAYLAWVKENPPEPRLPRLQKYTPKQMFWISAANLWCSKYRPEVLRNKILLDIHSPDRFRVIGPFSNREEFAQDFGCALGSKMNPPTKCEVW